MNAILKLEQPEVRSIARMEIPMQWHRLAELLLPVMRRDEVDNTLEDVRQFLISEVFQAWHINWETVFITQIQSFGADAKAPTKRVCAIVYCAGKDLERWLPFARTHFVEWAKTMNCSKLRITGRDGWEKVLPDFKKTSITVECNI